MEGTDEPPEERSERQSWLDPRHTMRVPLAPLALLACTIGLGECAVQYFGKFLGPLQSFHHGVTGDVYAVDARTLHVRDFSYDGEGPAAYFYVGSTKAINSNGFRLLDDKGQPHPLKRYRRKSITLTLPEGKTLANIKWFSVYCDEAKVNFADVKVPKSLDFPKPQKISPLAGVHAVSSEPIVVVDAQTLLVPSFSYDGEAPDAKFWVGRGPKPSPQGIRVPDENGKEIPLRRYDRKTIVLTLPGDLTVFEIGHFGIWCEAFTVDFGHIQVPASLNVPPSLKMLGVAPQSKLNCEVLDEDLAFEVRWAIAGDSIVVQLVSKLENGEYMSFGPSGSDRRNQMVGGDVVVAWVDHATLSGYAVDYYLDDKSQCSGTRGSCPDYRIDPENTSSVRLLNAALVNGYSIVTYQRPLRAHDALDRPIRTNGSQAVLWGVGPLNQKTEVSFHSVWSKEDILLDFGRTPRWNCPIPESDAALGASNEQSHEEEEPIEAPSRPKPQTLTETSYAQPPAPAPAARQSDAWEIPPIQCNEPDDGVFYAQMGPTGGKRGYPSITKHVGWGISYYINGLLIPEINVVRGRTYTFVVEGGFDASTPAKYHPFYITDDSVGGYANKSPDEQKKVRIFAGVEQSRGGALVPTGVGRLCNWTPDQEQPPADDFVSFGAYQRTLTLICDHGEPGVIQWTPDQDTPDTVYYQCFVHRYLGWKINVLDECDLPSAAASVAQETRVAAPGVGEAELEGRPSQRVVHRVRPEGPNSLPLVGEPKGASQQRHTLAPNHRYPSSTAEPQSITDGREMIPVSEDIQDVSTERPRPPLTPPGQNETRPSTHGVPYKSAQPVPVNRPPPRRPMATMTIIRPHRRPAAGPHHHMVMVHRPMALVASPSQYRPVFVKKPIYRMPAMAVHRPMMMMSHPQPPLDAMTPPRTALASPHPHHHSHPHPHSQMQPQSHVTKTMSVSYSSAKGKKPSPVQMKTEPTENKKYILPQNKLQHKPEVMYKPQQHPAVPPQPQTTSGGFNPGSLVIEGGFKPIVQTQSPQAEAQDRIAEVDEDEDDTLGTIDMSQAPVQEDEHRKEVKATEYFEPMFIPSPPDSALKHLKKQPQGVIKKKPYHVIHKPVRPQEMVIIRRRPVSPSFRSREEVDETAMAAERMDTFYLPPAGRTVLTYDGKPVPGNKVLPPPQSGSSKRRSSADLLRSPQFGPFRGDVPPPVPMNIRADAIPQLKFKGDSRPPHALGLELNPGPGRTQLKPVRNLEEENVEEEEVDRLVPEASELEEFKYEVEGADNSTEPKVIVVLAESPEEPTKKTEQEKRERRSAGLNMDTKEDNVNHDIHLSEKPPLNSALSVSSNLSLVIVNMLLIIAYRLL